MDEFERLLEDDYRSVERYVRFRLVSKTDAEDVLQEIYMTAWQKFDQLKKKDSFKSWIISIARNKCNDYFRKKAKQLEIPIGIITEKEFSYSRFGISEISVVKDTLDLLGDRDKQILYLYFWKELPQAEIAEKLNIPLGTVKSRLFTAKQNFKSQYSYHTGQWKGECCMKKLPEFLPQYEIEESSQRPFTVKWEELMGWFLVPKQGERLSWGMYDIPSRRCSHIYDMEVTGKAMVHGIEGVELTAKEMDYADKGKVTERTFVAQLTDTHCRYLAAMWKDGDTKNYITFLDGDIFMDNWGFGKDNCGNETNLLPKEDIKRKGEVITTSDNKFLLDIVGRYTIRINGKSFDTICVMDIETYNGGVVSEQFLDKNGRTILWRRFNRDDWAIDRYKKKWSELLPDNERFTINGEIYVHWYDCITNYSLDLQ